MYRMLAVLGTGLVASHQSMPSVRNDSTVCLRHCRSFCDASQGCQSNCGSPNTPSGSGNLAITRVVGMPILVLVPFKPSDLTLRLRLLRVLGL